MAHLDFVEHFLFDRRARALCFDSSVARQNHRHPRHGARAARRPVFSGDFIFRRGRSGAAIAGRKRRHLGHWRGAFAQRHRAFLDQFFLENLDARGGFVFNDFSRRGDDPGRFPVELGMDGSGVDVGARDPPAAHHLAGNRRLRGRLRAHFGNFVGFIFALHRFLLGFGEKQIVLEAISKVGK